MKATVCLASIHWVRQGGGASLREADRLLYKILREVVDPFKIWLIIAPARKRAGATIRMMRIYLSQDMVIEIF
jgi:hypothetical protein